MTTAEKAWRDVRRSNSFPVIIARAQLWIEEVWPVARALGHTRFSTRDLPVPLLEVDDYRGRHTSGYWVDDMIIIPSRKTLKAQLDRYLMSASPTLDWTMAIQTIPEFLRSIIVHEMQHAFDDVDDKWLSSQTHDKRFWNRLTKLEGCYNPLGL